MFLDAVASLTNYPVEDVYVPYLQNLVNTHSLREFHIYQNMNEKMDRDLWQSCLPGLLVEVKFYVECRANSELHTSLINVVVLDNAL